MPTWGPRRCAKEAASLWGSSLTGCGLRGPGPSSAYLVLPQLLLYNVIPVLHGLLQPPEAWGGEELGQGAEGCSCWKEACPPPSSQEPGLSGLHLLTLRKGMMSKIWTDQWSQVSIRSWTQS